MSEKGKLYGVGVGPGDPELLTLKAQRILKSADIIAVPDKGSGEKTALNIVKEEIQGKQLLFCATPMTRDREKLEEGYEAVARNICTLLDQGKTVAFITLGDPTIYSTYIYIHKKVVNKGYFAEIISGVPSFCAVASTLGVSLCERSERLMIVPASHNAVGDCLETDANLVFMKTGKQMGQLKETLEKENRLEGASMVENCGMEGERVFPSFSEAPEDSGYFSVVIVKAKEEK